MAFKESFDPGDKINEEEKTKNNNRSRPAKTPDGKPIYYDSDGNPHIEDDYNAYEDLWINPR